MWAPDYIDAYGSNLIDPYSAIAAYLLLLGKKTTIFATFRENVKFRYFSKQFANFRPFFSPQRG